jgi:hypothetical protein
MPPECEFYVPKSLKRVVEKEFNAKERDALKERFVEFDLNGSGAIDFDELRVVFESLGVELDIEDFEALWKEMDSDGSGAVDYDEFLLLMLSIEKKNHPSSFGKAFGKTFNRILKTDKYENENRYAAPKALEDETKKETKKRVKAEKIAAKKAKKRAKTWIGKREAMYPHGQECFCGCRHKAMQGKKKREGVIFYTMDNGVWVRDSAGASCVIM